MEDHRVKPNGSQGAPMRWAKVQCSSVPCILEHNSSSLPEVKLALSCRAITLAQCSLTQHKELIHPRSFFLQNPILIRSVSHLRIIHAFSLLNSARLLRLPGENSSSFAHQHLFPVGTLNDEPLSWDRPVLVLTQVWGGLVWERNSMDGPLSVPTCSSSMKNRKVEAEKS